MINNQKASLLILTLWVLLFFSILVTSIGFTVRQRIRLAQKIDTRQSLRFIAEAGVKQAIDILNQKKPEETFVDAPKEMWAQNSGAFKSILVGDGSFDVSYQKDAETWVYGIQDEERKININLTNAQEVITRLLEASLQMESNQAQSLAQSIIDFRDEDEFSFDQGAESKYYESLSPPYNAKNKPYETMEELLLVKGMTPEILKQIEPYITLWSSGKVNLNTANSLVLKALGIHNTVVDKIISYRKGVDQIEGTPDDLIFDALGTVTDTLNHNQFLDDTEKGNLEQVVQSGQIEVFSKFFKIRSTAKLNFGTEKLMVECIVERFGAIKKWHERFYSE